MGKKNGVNNTPQTENQVVENEVLTTGVISETPVVADPAQAPEVSIEGESAPDSIIPEREHFTGELLAPVAHTPEEVTILGKAEPEAPERHIDEELAPLTDEDILKKVAEAAHTESGSIQRWEDLHEESKKSLIRAAKYFRDNPEAHADQWYGVLRSEHPELAFYYDLPETTRNTEEAFAASVKNAYKA